MDAYYSDGEHDVFSTDYTVGPGNAIQISGDGDVNYDDLEILASQWVQAPGNPSADIAPRPDGDGIVNIEDLALFAQHWIEGT